METKDLAGMALLLMAIPMGTVLCCLSNRIREASFFLMAAGAVFTERLDINLFTRYWYRGTTRGIEVTFIDVLAVCLLASLLILPRAGRPRAYWPAGLGVMLLFLLYSGFSVVMADPKLFGLFELSKMIRGIIIFLTAAFFVRTRRELELLALALACAVSFEGALAIKQRVWSGVYRVTGSLDHPNSLSIYLCMTAPLLVAACTSDLPLYVRRLCGIAVGFATIAIVLTISRAGIPFFALVMLGATACCISWRITVKKLMVTAFICLALCVMLVRSWTTLSERFFEASLQEEYLDEHSEGRGMYLRQARAILEDRLFGVGLNNWSYWVSKSYGAQIGEAYEDYDDLDYVPSKEILASINYAAPAHNLAALTVGELGVPGLLLFALVWLRWFQMGLGFLWKRSDSALHKFGVGLFFAVCGVFLQSLTEWVYRQTQIYLTFHLLLGTLASLYYLRKNPVAVEVEPVEQWEEAEAPAELVPAN